jgi:transcriptional regulator with XRE-family HTH domain
MDQPSHEWLRDQLHRRGISQSALGREFGFDPATINRMVHGTRRITAEDMARMRRFFDAPEPANSTSTISLRSVGNGMAVIEIRKTVPMSLALKVVALIEEQAG